MLESTKEKTKETEELKSEEDFGELTEENFQSSIKAGISFVKFFAPWCGHCKRLSPTWNSLRKKFENHPTVNIFKVDCISDANKELCNAEKIDSFPTLYLYKDGVKILEYSGSRSLNDLTDFLKTHLGHDEL